MTSVDPELTLNGNYALCYITHVFSEPTIKIWMKMIRWTHIIGEKNVAQGS